MVCFVQLAETEDQLEEMTKSRDELQAVVEELEDQVRLACITHDTYSDPDGTGAVNGASDLRDEAAQ